MTEEPSGSVDGGIERSFAPGTAGTRAGRAVDRPGERHRQTADSCSGLVRTIPA